MKREESPLFSSPLFSLLPPKRVSVRKEENSSQTITRRGENVKSMWKERRWYFSSPLWLDSPFPSFFLILLLPHTFFFFFRWIHLRHWPYAVSDTPREMMRILYLMHKKKKHQHEEQPAHHRHHHDLQETEGEEKVYNRIFGVKRKLPPVMMIIRICVWESVTEVWVKRTPHLTTVQQLAGGREGREVLLYLSEGRMCVYVQSDLSEYHIISNGNYGLVSSVDSWIAKWEDNWWSVAGKERMGTIILPHIRRKRQEVFSWCPWNRFLLSSTKIRTIFPFFLISSSRLLCKPWNTHTHVMSVENNNNNYSFDK